VYSANAQIPEAVQGIVREHREYIELFDVVRAEHTLVVKRFGELSARERVEVERSLGSVLREWAPIGARGRGFDVFTDPPDGQGPVLYLAVESPGLEALHRNLLDAFGAVSSRIEGDSYVPHITLARGGDRTAIGSLTSRSVEPVEWMIEEVYLWDARYQRPITHYRLPHR